MSYQCIHDRYYSCQAPATSNRSFPASNRSFPGPGDTCHGRSSWLRPRSTVLATNPERFRRSSVRRSLLESVAECVGQILRQPHPKRFGGSRSGSIYKVVNIERASYIGCVHSHPRLTPAGDEVRLRSDPRRPYSSKKQLVCQEPEQCRWRGGMENPSRRTPSLPLFRPHPKPKNSYKSRTTRKSSRSSRYCLYTGVARAMVSGPSPPISEIFLSQPYN